MVPPRHRIPTPAWAELPTDSAGSNDFRPFVTDAFVGRPIAPIGNASFGNFPDTQPVLRDEDGDAPQASLF